MCRRARKSSKVNSAAPGQERWINSAPVVAPTTTSTSTAQRSWQVAPVCLPSLSLLHKPDSVLQQPWLANADDWGD
jgi:hypothetical protein